MVWGGVRARTNMCASERLCVGLGTSSCPGVQPWALLPTYQQQGTVGSRGSYRIDCVSEPSC